MTRRATKLVAALAVFGVLQAGSVIAEAPSGPVLLCSRTAGYVQGPFVPTEAMARKLFGIYLDKLSPGRRDPLLHRVIVADGGDLWHIREDNRVHDDRGRVVSLMGGAGFAISIDKCTGAVLSATNQR